MTLEIKSIEFYLYTYFSTIPDCLISANEAFQWNQKRKYKHKTPVESMKETGSGKACACVNFLQFHFTLYSIIVNFMMILCWIVINIDNAYEIQYHYNYISLQ